LHDVHPGGSCRMTRRRPDAGFLGERSSPSPMGHSHFRSPSPLAGRIVEKGPFYRSRNEGVENRCANESCSRHPGRQRGRCDDYRRRNVRHQDDVAQVLQIMRLAPPPRNWVSSRRRPRLKRWDRSPTRPFTSAVNTPVRLWPPARRRTRAPAAATHATRRDRT